MFKQIDKRFKEIKGIFQKNDASTALIEKAYLYAKNMHKNQIRKDGTPYLGHPVEVAYILATLGYDEDVVSAGLLHDVVEDCGSTIEEIQQQFNSNVSELVNCVSAIDKAKYIYDEEDIYENINFQKASIEEQSFKKLIGIGKKNPLGFCIKFADRLHNLSTISCFDYNKQLEKLKETEKWIIPIAKILNSEYFYNKLRNECFKILHKFDGENFFVGYKEYHNASRAYYEQFVDILNETFSSSKIKKIESDELEEYRVFEYLKDRHSNINISKATQGYVLKVANYKLYLLYDSGNRKDIINDVLTILSNRLTGKLKIIDAKIGNITQKPFIVVQDCFGVIYNIYIMSISEYIIQKNGTLDGQQNDYIDDDNLDNLGVELMGVKTRSGEVKYIPSESTVLDFAFKIHKDIGLGFKYAIINKSKTKSPPYAKLYEGDAVEIIVERDENNEIIKSPDLKWFAYVNSELAKKMLIKWFSKKIN